MKKIILLIAICISSITYAQQRDQQRLEALKVAFITERLNLSTTEAQQFWPIYNAYTNALEDLRLSNSQVLRRIRSRSDEPLDENASPLLENYITIETQKLSLKTKFLEDLRAVISDYKILKLIKTEEAFKRKLLQELRNRKRSKN